MNNLKEIIEYSSKLKLLYVEDDEDTRNSTISIFEDFFNDITIAVDGKDGYKKFTSKDIDLIITDINMPNLNGFDMIEKIRAIDKDIPILIMSAHNEPEYLIKGTNLDTIGYLQKPIELDQFLSALLNAVKN